MGQFKFVLHSILILGGENLKILVYNNLKNKMEVYWRELDEPIPYSDDKYLSVREFRGSSRTDTMWTDKRAIQAFNKTRRKFGSPIKVGYAFKRVGEGGHGQQSQHYAGMAFDMGQNLTNSERDRLRKIAAENNTFTYVEPAYLTPTWVHADKRLLPPACASGGYPLIKQGNRGVYTAVLQDALNTIGYNAGTIDGMFGTNTKNAVVRFQKAKRLSPDGIVGCNTWTALMAAAVPKG